MPLPPRARILIPMLASDIDGEVINAVRALGRTLKAEGLDFHDLATGVSGAARPCPVCAERERARTQRKTKGSHAADLSWLLDQPYTFTPNEAEFLKNLTAWDGELTVKQAAWFQKILAKVRTWSESEF